MILTCPSCGTRYVVKDGAIPDGGRTVRCAQCKHSWHQQPDGEPASEGHPTPAPAEPRSSTAEPVQRIPERGRAEAVPEPGLDQLLSGSGTIPRMAELGDHAHPGLAASPDDPDAQPLPGPGSRPQASDLAGQEPSSVPLAEAPDERDTMPAEAAAAPDPYPEEVVPTEESVPERTSHPIRAARAEPDDYSPFAARDDDRERPRTRWPLLAAMVLLAVVAIAVAFWFLAPSELKSRVGLAQADNGSTLLLQVNQYSRRPLASGNQLFEVSGTVINPTDDAQAVPPLQAQLRGLDQQVVYRWTIPPPAPRLAPGGSASFNSAELNIPPNAACLDVFFGKPTEPQPPCRGTAGGA